MKNFSKFLKKFIKNAYFVSLILLIIASHTLHQLYKTNYRETVAISYASERLTIKLEDHYYLEVYRLHDYFTTDTGDIITLINELDSPTASYKKDFINGSVTEVTESVEHSTTSITSQLRKSGEDVLYLTRKVSLKDPFTMTRIDSSYVQFVLGGGEYQYNDSQNKLHAGRCILTFSSDKEIHYRFQQADNVLTIYKSIDGREKQLGLYEFNLNIHADCKKNS